jgi:AraC family transcriptional regulator of adaptative response / DNA-3-methyladenine glycosylase II
MELDHAACRAAVRARDARFDGMFYAAVKTTGIYCRPICPAKTPKPENVTFYETAAAAEAAGFRPCLRCRPELSPAAQAQADGLAREFVRLVQRDGLFGGSVESAAAQLGVSSRHLRRTVEQECGVSPLELVLTTRLLFARRLLSSTVLPVSRIAFGSGFSSLARFNATFRGHYGMAPSAFRRQTLRRANQRPGVRLALAYREPFAWDAMLAYWTRRAIPGVESIVDGCYWRTVRVGGRVGWFSAKASRGVLDVEVSDDLASHLLPVAGRIRAMFDLDANPAQIATVLGADPALQALVERTPGLRVPGAFDPFELALRAILGQQVTVAAASTLAGRLVERFATAAQDLPAGLSHYPLTAESIAAADAADIAAIGIPSKRAATIRALAEAVARGNFDFAEVTAIPGIGPWTRDYIALRALRRPDAFPEGDLGLRKALTRLGADPERWRPWRAYAAMYLWTS